MVHWSIGPLVECPMLNVKFHVSNVKNQMSNVTKVKLLSERTSPVIFWGCLMLPRFFKGSEVTSRMFKNKGTLKLEAKRNTSQGMISGVNAKYI